MHALVAAAHGGCDGCGCALLNLEKEGGVLDFNQRVDVLETGLHEGHLRLDRVVPEGDRLPHHLLAACHEVRRQQLYKLVLYVLYEVEFRRAVSAHDEDREETVRLLDT
jgi:hypothetical protein